MKVRTKLLIGFSVFVVLLWVIALYAGSSFGNLYGQFKSVDEEIIPGTFSMVDLETTCNNIYHETMRYIIYDSADAKDAAMSGLSHLQEIQTGYVRQDKPYISIKTDEVMEGRIVEFYFSIANLLEAKKRGYGYEDLMIMDRRFSFPALLSLQQIISERKAQYITQVASVETAFHSAYYSDVRSLFIIAGLFTLLAIGAALFLSRSILRPLGVLHKGTEMIAGGDLNYKVGTRASDEIGQLSRAFDQMTQSLSNSMTSIDNLNQEINERKRAEAALRESEDKFSKAFRSSPNAIAITTLKNGEYVEVNDSYCRATGYSAQELIGRTAQDVNIWAGAEDRARMFNILEEKGGVYNEEIDFRTKSGKIHTWLFSAETIEIAGEPCLIGVSVDITERKKTERALADELTRRRILIDQSLDGIVVLDVNAKVVEANQRFAEMLGYTPEEVRELHTWDWDTQYPREQLLEMGRNVDEKGLHLETYHRRKDGSNIDVDISVNGVVVAGQKLIFCVCRDVTKRKQAEKALQESEEKFSKAFRSSPETIAITTIKEGKFIEVNESFSHITGYTRGEVIGYTSIGINIWATPDERSRMLQIMKEQGRVYNEEFSFRMKSGEIRTWLFSGEKIDIGGEPCIISITTDITERKKAEEELKQALARLAATNKELETFSYSVSHDLRSPLRSIDGFSQALLEDYQSNLDETGQDYLKRLRGASQKMGELIDGLLRLSRLTRSDMRFEEVNLTALAEEISARLKETQPKRPVKFYIKPDVTAYGDPQLLRVLLENLLGNAWKFTGKKTDAKIEFGTSLTSEKKTYYVKDNGAGFDMAYADKLFGAFQRLHDTAEYPGTGIGLATVQRVINRHGGTVRAEGEPGKGATFYFTLT
jgi:PAS domain S-box-containing protein